MMMNLFKESGLDELASKVRRLLRDTGYKIGSDALAELLRRKGLRQAASGRFVFDGKLIDEVSDFQRKYPLGSRNQPPPSVSVPADVFRLSFGNMVSKYYDYSSGRHATGKVEYFERLVKFAHQEGRVSGVSCPLSVVDYPPETWPLKSYLLMRELTNKTCGYIDPYSAPLVKYIAELCAIFKGPGQESYFLDPCNCVNPIMSLEARTADVMLERAKHKVKSMITSMPTAGGNAPVTLDGTIVQAAAEIVGGIIISWIINPECELMGYISSSALDFKTAVTTQSAPETVLIDCGVIQLMNHAFGGNTTYGGASYVAAREPGLTAVYEKMFKSLAYSRILGDSPRYAGGGVIDNGASISPEQLVIDMEISESVFSVKPLSVRNDSIEEVIAEVVDGGNMDFLSNEHTLNNYKKAFFEPVLFTRGTPSGENEILKRAHDYFCGTADSYKGFDCGEPDKLKAGYEILRRAEKEILGLT
jgi:trimethylamine:corrinoid methyltransferase-like protein